MDIVSDIATIVGLVRDVFLLILLAVALIALLAIISKVKRLLDSATRTVETVQEAVENISERVVEPATSNAGTARRVGSVAGLLLGLFRRNRDKDRGK